MSEDYVRKALWSLMENYGDQKKICTEFQLGTSGFSKVLAGELPPTDRMCRVIGWEKVGKRGYKRIQINSPSKDLIERIERCLGRPVKRTYLHATPEEFDALSRAA